MKKKKVTKHKKGEPGKFWSSSEKKVLISIGITLLVVIILLFSNVVKEKLTKENAYKAYIGKEVPDSMVCMVSGQVKEKAIKPIVVEGKIYWGCCSKCIAKLKNNVSNIQFATDPLSKVEINKSQAYIRLNPANKRKVIFFETKESYQEYVKIVNEK